MKKILKSTIFKEIKRLDKTLEEDQEGFKAAAILLASVCVGPNQKKIAAFLKYPRTLVAKFASNLKQNKIWRGKKVYANWGDKKNGVIEFWCDVLVAQGLLKRVSDVKVVTSPIEEKPRLKV